MAHFSRTQADWPNGYVPTPTDFNALDDKSSKAVNGDEGGVWAPSAAITVGGQGMAIVSAASLRAEGTGRIRSATVGGIELGAGATDWPKFTDTSGVAAVRQRTVMQPFKPWKRQQDAAWPESVSPLITEGTASAVTPAHVLIEKPHNAAKILAAEVIFFVADPHASGVPASLPKMALYLLSVAGGISYSLLAATWKTLATPANGAAYYQGGYAKSLILVPDQNEIVNADAYVYYLVVYDESGTNAVAGNRYTGVRMYYEVGDMRFP